MTIVDIFFAGFAISISYFSEKDSLEGHKALELLQKRVFEIKNIDNWLKHNKNFPDYTYTPNLSHLSLN